MKTIFLVIVIGMLLYAFRDKIAKFLVANNIDDRVQEAATELVELFDDELEPEPEDEDVSNYLAIRSAIYTLEMAIESEDGIQAIEALRAEAVENLMR